MTFEVSVVTHTDADSVEGDTDVCAIFLRDMLGMSVDEAKVALTKAMFFDVDIQWPITVHITVQGRDPSERKQTPLGSLLDLAPGDWKFRYMNSGDTDEDL